MITITGIDSKNWNGLGSSKVEARWYPSAQFISTEGDLIKAGSMSQQKNYFAFPCIVSGATIEIPNAVLPIADGGKTYYSLEIVISGLPVTRKTIFTGYEVPSQLGATITYKAFYVFNQAKTIFYPAPEYLNKEQVYGVFAAIIAAMDLSDAVEAAVADAVSGILSNTNLTGIPTAPTAAVGTATSQLASCAFVIAEILARVASLDVARYIGVIDCSTNPNYPAADSGHIYRISVSGKIGGASGASVTAGDMLICHLDNSSSGNHATVGANWDLIRLNISGGTGDVVGAASSVDGQVAVADGVTGKIIKFLSSSGYLKLAAGVASVLNAAGLKTELALNNVQNVDTTTTANINDSANKRFATDAEKTKVGLLTVTGATDLDSIRARVLDLDAAVILRGTWNAGSGSFPGGGTAQAGASYIVDGAGTVNGVSFAVGDRIIAVVDNASTTTFASNWFKADYTDQFLSLDGQTGTVTLGTLIATLTAKTTPVDADEVAIRDTAASNATKRLSLSNLWNYIKSKADPFYAPSAWEFVVDNGSTVIGTGKKFTIKAAYRCQIKGWTIAGEQSGSIVFDIKKATYSSWPTTTSITSSAKPTLTTAQKAASTTLTGWTVQIEANEMIEIYVDSATTVTKALLALDVERN